MKLSHNAFIGFLKKTINLFGKYYLIFVSGCTLLFFIIIPAAYGVPSSNNTLRGQTQGVQVINEDAYATQNPESEQANRSSIAQQNTSTLSMNQKLNKLEQQFKNLQAMDTSEQIMTLQQDIQQLRGKVGRQAIEIYKLKSIMIPSIHAGKPEIKPIIKNMAIKPSKIKLTKQPDIKVQNYGLSEQETYSIAYQLFEAKKYSNAIASMKVYLDQYPNGSNSGNAHFYLGEMYLIQKQHHNAVSQFELLIKDYPHFEKQADVMLKLGFVYYDNGQLNKAKSILLKIGLKYPNSSAAKLAAARLQDINQQINSPGDS